MNKAKSGAKNSKGIPSSKLRNNIEVGINKVYGAKQIISISYRDIVRFDRYNRRWVVNGKAFDSKHYKIRIDKGIDLRTELKALVTINLLKKKLLTFFTGLDRLKYLSGDDALLKKRTLNKSKQIIKKYLSELKGDTNFNISRLENAISLNYLGEYTRCRRRVCF